MPEGRLKRTLSLPVLVLYGLGTTVGAGIYALVGKVSGLAGLYAPVAFLLASGLAGFTALSFAELSSRFPRAAGEAVYVQEGFGARRLGAFVGLVVAAAGVISAATVANGFAGYLGELVALPRWLAILGLVGALGGLAAWGIGPSALAAALMTVVEVGGLVWIVAAGAGSLAELPAFPELLPPLEADAWRGVLAASLLCFYAYLGFEDMVNVAEEVRDVRRAMPVAILTTLATTTVLYLLVVVVGIALVPPAELAASEAPIARIYQAATGNAPTLISLIGVLAMVNGALIQLIKASRVLYGLADRGALPAALARVGTRTRTPLLATLLVTAFVAALALAFPIQLLAEATSILTIGVFALANAALWWIHRAGPAPAGVFSAPRWIPVAGALSSAGLLAFELVHRLGG